MSSLMCWRQKQMKAATPCTEEAHTQIQIASDSFIRASCIWLEFHLIRFFFS